MSGVTIPEGYDHVVLGAASLVAASGPTWTSIVTAVGTSVTGLGVFIAIYSIRDGARTRDAATAAFISARWDSPELRSARRLASEFPSREALREAYFEARKWRTLDFYAFLTELDFFEDLGTLGRLGGVSLEWIELRMRSSVLNRWDLWHVAIEAMRNTQPTAYENFGRLYDTLIMRRDYPGRWNRWCYRWNIWCHGVAMSPSPKKQKNR